MASVLGNSYCVPVNPFRGVYLNEVCFHGISGSCERNPFEQAEVPSLVCPSASSVAVLGSLHHHSWREQTAPGRREERDRSLLQKGWGNSASWCPQQERMYRLLAQGFFDHLANSQRLENNSDLDPWGLLGLIIERKEQRLIPPFFGGETSQEPQIFLFPPIS